MTTQPKVARAGLLLLLLWGCDSVKHKTESPVYHERVVIERPGAVTVLIDRTHQLLPREGGATWRMAGSKITTDTLGRQVEPLAVYERPLRSLTENQYRALDTGACYEIQAEQSFTVRSCEPSPHRPSLIVEAYL